MPTIKMRVDMSGPRRVAGKVYLVTQAEGWLLVRDGFASWKYVPQSTLDTLTASEPEAKKEIKGALRTEKAK